jgi:hypothetical protein
VGVRLLRASVSCVVVFMRKLQLETCAELVTFALANGVVGPNAD